MTIQEARAELQELSNLKAYMVRIKRQRDELWTKFTSIKITNYQSQGVHSTFDQEAQLAEIVDKLTTFEKQLTDAFYKAQERESALREKVNHLPFPYGEILTRRYIERHKLEKISYEMGYTYFYLANKLLPKSVKKYAEL